MDPPSVTIALVHRSHVYMHYYERKYRNEPYVISVRPLNSYSIRITLDAPSANPRYGFESMFVRDEVLVLGTNRFIAQGSSIRSDDFIFYASANKLNDAKLISVSANGKPNRDPLSTPSFLMTLDPLWYRNNEVRYTTPKPGHSSTIHTAMAALGDNDVLVFSLVHTDPQKEMPEPPLRIVMTRVTPELEKPKEQPAGEMVAGFTEPFQAYVVDDDYYFLTRSGYVYRSPQPVKGKSRTMTPVWTAPKPRVQYVISDGSTGVHYLITERERWKFEYIRLEPTPEPKKLDKVVGIEKEGPVEQAYWLTRALNDNKLIVMPK